ncbi:MAG: hypothetical protein KAS23_16050 [Anaerohalosphaera sp.]|nr:hypothetical protein [Anaerohalosphaera sp.]
MPDGTVDKGSKPFKDKKVAQSFKKHFEKQEHVLKRAEIVEQSCWVRQLAIG